MADLEFVKSGDARVRITGNVALADEEFATVAEGAVEGLVISTALITLWLFLAVRSWRLIVPILLTLGLGLLLTVLFAAAAVGTLNLVSVGFGILFVGIAVDFAIQFCVRYRGMRLRYPDPDTAMTQTGWRVGAQILVAAAATAAGFLAFVPTDFKGVAELGLIAGVGMLIAFLCTMLFLPAAITLFRPSEHAASIGFGWAAPLDRLIGRHRWLLLGIFGVIAALGVRAGPAPLLRLRPLAHEEPEYRGHADTLRSDGLAGHEPVHDRHSDAELRRRGEPRRQLGELSLVGEVITINSFVPKNQEPKLALIADAANILSATLLPMSPRRRSPRTKSAWRPRRRWSRSSTLCRSCPPTIPCRDRRRSAPAQHRSRFRADGHQSGAHAVPAHAIGPACARRCSAQPVRSKSLPAE